MSWAERALGEVLSRAAETESLVGERWPLHADPLSGRWTTTARGSWTGGFWAGLLWLRAIVSGELADQAAASIRTMSLAPWVGADTATRGLIFWYGTALAECGAGAATLRDRAARACLDAYDPRLGLVPWGAAFGGPRELARADALPGLVRLLAYAGPHGRNAAQAQLDLQLKLSAGGGEPHPAWAALPDGSWVPHPEPPVGWSRTVAWLALAIADSAHAGQAPRAGGPPFQPTDHPALEERLAPGSPAIPPASALRPGGPPDTSAAAIEAVAALKLSALAGRRTSGALRDRAADVLGELVAAHLRDGRLLDGCYDLDHGVATRHELVWGDFFLAVGLAILTDAIAPFAC